MKLALVTHNVLRADGQGRVVSEIALHALAAGVRVSLLADRVDPDLVDAGAEWIPVQPRLRATNLIKVWEFATEATRVLERLNRCFHVVHANGFVLNLPHHVNTAHLVHGAWLQSPFHTSRVRGGVYGLYHRVYSGLNARWERSAYREARRVVAVSDRVRDDLLCIGVPEARIRVVWNGVDPVEFSPGSVSRHQLGLPEEVSMGLFVGDLRTPLKNLDTVLRALAQVPELHLAVVGHLAGSLYPAMVNRLGLLPRVHFLGFRRDIADLMRASDVFVFPSRYESFSLVLMEAMACGLPVVTARSVGAAALVPDGAGVVLEDPNDHQALAWTLASVVHHPDQWRLRRDRAREAAEMYTWRRMADHYLNLYEEVVR